MMRTLKAILQEEREKQTIHELCKEFGFTHPKFVVNQVVDSNVNSKQTFFLIVQPDSNVPSDKLSSFGLKTMLTHQLGIEIDLMTEEQINKIYRESILQNSLSLLDNEEKFKNLFQQVGDMAFEDVVYPALKRTPAQETEFEDELRMAQWKLKENQTQYSASALFHTPKPDINSDRSSPHSSENISPEKTSLEKAVENKISEDKIPLIKKALLKLPPDVLARFLEDLEDPQDQLTLREFQPNKQRKLF